MNKGITYILVTCFLISLILPALEGRSSLCDRSNIGNYWTISSSDMERYNRECPEMWDEYLNSLTLESVERERKAFLDRRWEHIILDGEVIGIAIKDNDLYGVSTDKKIWKHPLSGTGDWGEIIKHGWYWSKIIDTGDVIGIAIKDNDLYGIGTDNKIWKHSLSGSGGWSKIIDTGEVIGIAIKDNYVYGVGLDKQIWKRKI